MPPPSKTSTVWRRWRTKHLLSQRQFALAMGIAERTVFNVEHGVVEPKWGTQKKFEQLTERYKKNRRRMI